MGELSGDHILRRSLIEGMHCRWAATVGDPAAARESTSAAISTLKLKDQTKNCNVGCSKRNIEKLQKEDKFQVKLGGDLNTEQL